MAYRKILPVFALLLAAAPAHGQPAASEPQKQIIALVEQRRDQVRSTALKVWNFAEMGYLEEKSSRLLQDELKKAGFKVQSGVAGLPTGFVASFRTGDGPVVGILAEFDALPGLSQAAAPERQTLGAAAGHACGHNLFGAASVGAAIALKRWMELNNIKGEVRVYGTPAEEGGGGKVYMARGGLFDDLDVVLHWHAGDQNSAAQAAQTSNISGKFRFRGVAAHAAGSPDRGRSALDAVQIMDVSVNFMREHMPEGIRVHNITTRGGSAPNIVPDFAESYYYVRHVDPAIVQSVLGRIKKAADGAALATETSVEFELINGVYSVLPNDTLGRLVDANLRVVGGVQWTEQDHEFARRIGPTLGNVTGKLSAAEIAPYSVDRTSYGSTDVGDVSWIVPTVGFNAATWVPGTAGHSWQAVAASGSEIGIGGAMVAAKTLALSGAQLLTNPKVIADAKAELQRRRGPTFKYVPLVGDRKPPLDYRKPERATS